MKLFLPFLLVAGAKLVASQSICVKYTKLLFTNDTADNELQLITDVVNLAVLGDDSRNVTGILAADGGLLGFFSGEAGNTTNRGGSAVSINFLDGAADLPNPSQSSNTYILLLHLYQFFGSLLGCTAAGFPEYTGIPDMYQVHKFMDISLDMNNYFISQVGASASALGVTDDDVGAIATALDSLFNTRCPPILTENDAVPEFLVGTNPSICTDETCPLAINATCDDSPPSDQTICMKYTIEIFKNDTADNELALIAAVVNLAVLGNATLNVSGILATDGGLLGFFSGEAGNTTNRGGSAVSINFLDGAADLPNPSQSSNTYILLLHLYQFFGSLLGCTAAGFPEYSGVPDMYQVHKFMDISLDMNNYFISQVGASASALGVTDEDVAAIGGALDSLFNTRCPPILTENDAVPAFLVGTNPSICTDETCPLAINATCSDAAPTAAPIAATTPAPVAAPTDQTLCMKYTIEIFKSDTADNELALISAVVNLAVLGNATLNVDGILAADGGLLGFFSGAAGNTTNRGGTAVSINFLDGAADLPNPSQSSNTYILLLHLYQFFGALLGCTAAGFPEYSGMADMYEVHKFMGITLDMNNYFITQVGAAASALGVTDDDVTAIANVLNTTFNTRCPPDLTDADAVPEFLVGTNPSICTDDSCPLAVNATCTDDVTLCSKYAASLLGGDTAENELTLIMLVVNLAVLGNETLNVPGILADNAGLKPIFNGAAGMTTNRGGTAVQINFIDGGTNTATLLEHLYQFFGALLGCSAAGFPTYQGVPDMFSVHKFMDITLQQNDYFISQVGAAAAALGVSDDDVQIVAGVLDGVFNTRCPPTVAAGAGLPDFLVGTNPSICTDVDTCPLDMNSVDTACMQASAPVKAPVKAPVSAPASGAASVVFGSVGITTVAVMALSWLW